MDLSKQVEGVISSSLVSISKKSGIDLKELRLELVVTEDDDVVIKQMKKSDYTPNSDYNIPWKDVLGLTLSMFKGAVKDKIQNALCSIETEEGFESKTLTCRIYAINSEGKPKLYLFKNGTPLREIGFENIL